MPELVSIATALPPHVLTQEGTQEILPALAGGDAQATRFRETVSHSRVASRRFVLPADELVRVGGVTERTGHYERHILALGEQVARSALLAAPIHPSAVDTFVSISCTGYLLPSLDVYLIPKLGLHPSVRRLPITGLGCSAGVAAVALTADVLEGNRTDSALIVSVELCSLCVQTQNPTATEVIGNVLFADAAAAALVSRRNDGHGPEILASRSVLWPGTTDMLGMRLTDTGLRLVLSPELPRVVRGHLLQAVQSFLGGQGVPLESISFWVVHPGGPKVLEAVSAALELPDHLMRPSWSALERCGNVSSATVFFILQALRDPTPPAPGSLGMLVAFGPGLSCEMVLLRAAGWLTRTP